MSFDIEAVLDTAMEQVNTGNLLEAQRLYRQVLQEDSRQVEALRGLAIIAYRQGKRREAIEVLQEALAIDPQYSEAHNDLGMALQEKGDWPAAALCFFRAISLQPDDAQAQHNLGAALRRTGDIDRAISASRAAIALQPDLADAHLNLGYCLRERGRFEEAAQSFQLTAALQPDAAEAHFQLADALRETGQFQQAIDAVRRAIALRPDWPEAWGVLGICLKRSDRLDEAVAAYRRAIALDPASAPAQLNLGSALLQQGSLDESIACDRRAIQLAPHLLDAHSNLLLTRLYDPATGPELLAGDYRNWRDQLAAMRLLATPSTAQFPNDRDPDRRLRIGYVSPDFRAHPVGWFLLTLLMHHDPQAVEIVAYSNARGSDDITEKLQAYVHVWRNIAGVPDVQVAQMIRQDRIDILIDLALHGAHNRLAVFAQKPAPVQATYLAYAGTSGLPTMDCRLSDLYLDPSDADLSVYSEKTIRLPNCYWCYQPSIDVPPSLAPPAAENGFITFGCLNHFCKVNQPLVRLWGRLMKATPASHLLLHSHSGTAFNRLVRWLQEEGVEAARIRLVQEVPLAEYFDLYRSIDIALDTHPFGGGTTTFDALWMGVPVVSLKGEMAVGRAGFSILSNLGLPELVAASPSEFIQIASALARDLDRLKILRRTLRDRMRQSRLMDAPAFAGSIEAAFRQMWKAWARSGRP